MTISGRIILRKREERRVLSGHLWIFSNEVETVEGGPESGQIVEIVSHQGRFIGLAFYNDRSLITARIFSRERVSSLEGLLRQRMSAAEKLRSQLGYGQTYRMVFGESDMLPGLIIDRYSDHFVIESFTSGIDAVLHQIVPILVEEYGAACIVEKSDSAWRSYEGLSSVNRVLYGSPGIFNVRINGISFIINILYCQKTGLFLDQRENWKSIERHAAGLKVLDCFSNDGGFALHAARAGAIQVTGVDSSATAVEHAQMNAVENELSHSTSFIQADVFKYLTQIQDAEYDIIVLDPPSFVRNRKQLPGGLKGYRKLHELALRKLKDGGILISCSCSQHVSTDDFLHALTLAAANSERTLVNLSISGAAMDHPSLSSMPETKYLTCITSYVTTRS